MHYSNEKPPPRKTDDETLAPFGDPVFELVDQPRLQLIGWGATGYNDIVTEVEVQYWEADETGDFHFVQYPTGPYGVLFDGHVHTDVPGSTRRPVDDVRGALEQHLSHHVVNYLINQPEFAHEPGSDEYHRTLGEWYKRVETLPELDSTLVVDGEELPAKSLAWRGFTVTSAPVGGRVVTLVIRDAAGDGFDLRLRRRAALPGRPAR